MAQWLKVAQVGEMAPGRVKTVSVGDKGIALCQVDGAYYVVDDVCTHDGGPLGRGELIGEALECPRHGARFSVKTGEVLALPAVFPIKTYPVRVEGSDIQIELEG